MSANPIEKTIRRLESLDTNGMLNADFLLTWDKSDQEIQAVFLAAELLARLRGQGISPRLFDSGLAISLFRDNSTRTRFSFAGACDLLGLTVRDLDEGTSQIAHGETVRETANMVSFMTEVFGIRDDMYIGKGHTYMKEVAASVEQGFRDGVLPRRPTVVNLQCDLDHPTQSMADAMHLIDAAGGLEALRGKKIAMSWAYSPSYGKPLSVPQGVVALMTRFGMDVVLAHPPGYQIMPEVLEIAGRNASESGGSFFQTDSIADAFEGADFVYPKSWAPFAAMERRTELYERGDRQGIAALEKELLAQNAGHEDWECSEELMKSTHDALYLHCLPADITGVSCKEGEVAASVFDRFRSPLYKQAGYKPYVIAAMIYLSKVPSAAAMIRRQLAEAVPRVRGAEGAE